MCKSFVAIQLDNGNLVSIETDYDSDEHTTICSWSDENELMEGITWHSWILQGVKDKRFNQNLTNYFNSLITQDNGRQH